MMRLDPFKIYTSQKGRKFKVVGVRMLEGYEKWINGVLKFHWVLTYQFLDDDSKIETYYDYNDVYYLKKEI